MIDLLKTWINYSHILRQRPLKSSVMLQSVLYVNIQINNGVKKDKKKPERFNLHGPCVVLNVELLLLKG